MALAAKFFVFISFAAVYVFSTELFPTVIRWDGGLTQKLCAFFTSWVWTVKSHAKSLVWTKSFRFVFVIMKTKVFENAFVVDSDLSNDPLLIFNIVFATWPTSSMFCSLFRNVGMGTSTSVARLGSFASPYVVHLVRDIIDRLFIFVCFFFFFF